MSVVHPAFTLLLPGVAMSGSGSSSAGGGGDFSYTPTHYVTDDAGGGGDGSVGSPWTAAEALGAGGASAGDVVRWAPGVYSGTSTEDNWISPFREVNNGTSENPIIHYAQNPATTTAVTADRSQLTHDGDLTAGEGCPALGSAGADYVIWDGFWIDEADANPTADTGACIFSGGSIGCEYRRLLVEGMDVSGGDTWASFPAENHNGFRFEGAVNCWARDCRVVGITNPSGTHNGSAVMVYSAAAGTSGGGVEYCTFEDCSGGIYVKGENGNTIGNFTIRFNAFDNINTTALEYGGHSGSRSRVYCNTVNGASMGITLGRDGAHDVDVFNNTFVGVNRGVYVKPAVSSSGFTCRNNIIYDVVSGSTTPVYLDLEGTKDETDLEQDYNCYYDPSSSDRWYSGGSAYTDFTTYGNSLSGTYEENSINTNPLFTNAATGDFTLGGSSPCLGAGSDYLSVFGETPNMGAFATSSVTVGFRLNPDYS